MVEDFDGPSSVRVKSATLSKNFLRELLALVSSNWAQVVFFQIWGIESALLLISERSHQALVLPACQKTSINDEPTINTNAPTIRLSTPKVAKEGVFLFFSLQLSIASPLNSDEQTKHWSYLLSTKRPSWLSDSALLFWSMAEERRLVEEEGS